MRKEITVERLRRAYDLYQKLSTDRLLIVARRPKGTYGILVDNDDYAIEYRKTEFRTHILDSYIRGTSVNWYYAPWLSQKDVEKRNKANGLEY